MASFTSSIYILTEKDVNKYIIGIDIGGTAVKLGLFDGDGKLAEKWQVPTRLGQQGRFVLPHIAAEAEERLRKKKLSWSDVHGIGIGVPGPVLDGRIVPLAVNLGWKEKDVAAEMRQLTGVSRIAAENDAKAAALGEYWKGGWENYTSAVMITIGTAVGGAVILNGRIVPGAFGAAGELSHIRVKPDETEPCACGKCGHLQQYVSAEGILRSYRNKVSGFESAQLKTVKDIFDAAKRGQEPALSTVKDTVRMLAAAMSAVSCVIDPELFIIGGGISNAGDFLLDLVRSEFKMQALPTAEKVRIEAAKTGNDAGIYGAYQCIAKICSN